MVKMTQVNGKLKLALFILALLSPAVGNAESPKCNCNSQDCLDVTELELKNGTVKSPEFDLTGIYAIKKVDHPTSGEFEAGILVFENAICVYGTKRDFEGNNIEIFLPNTTYLQLSLPSGAGNALTETDIGKSFRISGVANSGFSAWHVSQFVVDVFTMTPLVSE
jgi:hypothetical protein